METIQSLNTAQLAAIILAIWMSAIFLGGFVADAFRNRRIVREQAEELHRYKLDLMEMNGLKSEIRYKDDLLRWSDHDVRWHADRATRAEKQANEAWKRQHETWAWMSAALDEINIRLGRTGNPDDEGGAPAVAVAA
jgi:hypothetical protein